MDPNLGIHADARERALSRVVRPGATSRRLRMLPTLYVILLTLLAAGAIAWELGL